MNARQMAQQMRYVLGAAVWPEGAGALVFGDSLSYVLAGLPDEDELPGRFPFVLINLGGGTTDPDDPNLLEQGFDVLTVVDVPGGRLGEQALTGGAKSGLGTSANRGVLELNDRVRDALKDLRGVDGAALQLHATSTGAPTRLGRGRHLAIGESNFTAWVTAAPSYTHPTRLAESGGTWTWVGAQCSSRFDFLKFRLGYVDGAVPATNPLDLDVTVYTGSALTTDVGAVAGKAYSIFAEYNARGGSVREGASDGRELSAYLTT